MINVLLLSAGTNAAFHVSKIIKEKFFQDFKIIGTDINERHLIASCHYLDAFYQVPLITHPDYYSTILNICQKENIQFILPIFDADQQLLFPENKDLKSINVCSLSTPQSSLSFYRDKKQTFEFLQSINLPTPKIYNLSNIEDETFYFIKPINGNGSIGAQKKQGKEIKSISNIQNYIIQELCSNPEKTVECFYYNGKIKSIARERIASKAGVCTKTLISYDRALEEIAVKFAEKAQLPLCFNLQFMKNLQNDFVITDVNLRLAGGMSLSYAAGWDEVSALAHFMKGETEHVFDTFPDNIPNQYVVRAYTDIVTKIEKPRLFLDLDGTLLDSSLRHKKVLDDVLSEFNINISTNNLIGFKKDGKNNVDFMLAQRINKDTALKIQKQWVLKIENNENLSKDRLFPDTLNFLSAAIQKYDLYLLTARTNKQAVLSQLTMLGITDFFSQIFIVEPGKNAALEKTKILASNNANIMIGDTETDYEAAAANNISFFAINRGFRSQKYWTDKKIASYSSLSEIFNKL